MTQQMIDALGLSSIITEKLMDFNVIRKGKTGMADQIILSCLMTDIHKPELKNDLGTYMHDNMTEDERLIVHKLYTGARDRVQKVDNLLNDRGQA